MIVVAQRLLCNSVVLVENDMHRVAGAIAVALERRESEVVLAAVQSGRVNIDENMVLQAFVCTTEMRCQCLTLCAIGQRS